MGWDQWEQAMISDSPRQRARYLERGIWTRHEKGGPL